MKRISDKIQGTGIPNAKDVHLLARKVGSGEVGILIGFEVEHFPENKKKTINSIYWNSAKEAIEDLETVIEYFQSNEDEA